MIVDSKATTGAPDERASATSGRILRADRSRPAFVPGGMASYPILPSGGLFRSPKAGRGIRLGHRRFDQGTIWLGSGFSFLRARCLIFVLLLTVMHRPELVLMGP